MEIFSGVTSFVCKCPVDLAAELNLPVTAFIVNRPAPERSYDIRYFTTITEIPACGHATLAAARVLYERGAAELVYLHTINGIVIEAAYKNHIITLKYPVYSLVPCTPGNEILKSLDISEYKFSGICAELETLFIELDDPSNLRKIKPDFEVMVRSSDVIKEVVITSHSDDPSYDFLLRSFCPWIGINEDPVTGSVHSVLAGFWKEKLMKESLIAYQASERGGEVYVREEGGNVSIGGKTVIVLKGELL